LDLATKSFDSPRGDARYNCYSALADGCEKPGTLGDEGKLEMIRASAAIILLLGILFGLAKTAVIQSAPSTEQNERTSAGGEHKSPNSEDHAFAPPSRWNENSGTQPLVIPRWGNDVEPGSGVPDPIRLVDYEEVQFGGDSEPAYRVAQRVRGRRFMRYSPAPTQRSPRATTQAPARPGNSTESSSARSEQEPTPAVRDELVFGESSPFVLQDGPVSTPTPVAQPTAKGQAAKDYLEKLAGSGSQQEQTEAITDLKDSSAGESAKPTEPESASSEAGPVSLSADPWILPTRRLSPEMAARRERIQRVLDFYYTRPLNSKDHSPWSIMHTMIGWGVDSQIRIGGPNGQVTSAIRWLTTNGLSDGVRLLYTQNGNLQARIGPGLQGHRGQFLAVLAQTRVRRDFPIQVDGQTFTVEDLIELEKASCETGTELTFQLIGLVHYLPTDSQWTSLRGQTWDFPRLLREEIAAPINGVTCGGTHRLMGLTYAVRRREYEGLPVDGQWARAQKYTADYQEFAYRLQNRDGSFSSDFFRKRGDWGDNDRKMKTTGHILEWLVFSLPQDRLQDPRLLKSLDYLTDLMWNNRFYDWEKGPIGHGIRALSLYDERVFGQSPGHRSEKIARRPAN
ncbi:MAG: hypothetical protein KDA60_05040, partial [Planctomycetales bacterium]|nr:hypothetical protein [Planctomycetales bacterium]